jgi:1-acyl-sn-glycerol-3-phosphate acyltransferase
MNLPQTRARDRFGGPVELPARRLWLLRLFRWYAHRYVRKHFHAVRLSGSGSPFPPAGREPTLIVLNHPSWWDPMVCLVLSRLISDREQFAAIDAEAVKRYGFFKKIGFIGVDTNSLRGAVDFVRTGAAILAEPNRVYWVTAQGRFTDVRERPLAIHSGVGHLAARMADGIVLPLALEYTFWTERTPEALVRFGQPLRVADDPGLTAQEWTRRIEEAMTRNLDVLNAEAMSRDPARFRELLTGRAGIGGPYDAWRRVKSWLRGERFDPSHAAAMMRKKP